MDNKKGILIVVSGFSGSGKGTIMSRLMEEHPDIYALSISATTRAPRPGEAHGREYFFVSTEEFESMIARQELIEYLSQKEIGTIIHYPIPPHLSEAYAYLGHKRGDFPVTESYADTVLSIPMYTGMTRQEQDYVIEAVNAFT